MDKVDVGPAEITQKNTRRSPNVGTMSGQRRRQWANIVPTLGERPVFSGKLLSFLKERRPLESLTSFLLF